MLNIAKRPYDENGKPHGEWIVYYKDGTLKYHCNYVHGKRHGLEKIYYDDGSLKYYGFWKNKLITSTVGVKNYIVYA